jgi:hypothetical protein
MKKANRLGNNRGEFIGFSPVWLVVFLSRMCWPAIFSAIVFFTWAILNKRPESGLQPAVIGIPAALIGSFVSLGLRNIFPDYLRTFSYIMLSVFFQSIYILLWFLLIEPRQKRAIPTHRP